MVNGIDQIAQLIEVHEAFVWSLCVDAAAAVPGNPFKAEVDRGGNTALGTLAALNFAGFNRVIALGIESPASDEDIEYVQAFYSSRSQSRYTVEVTPASRPETIRDSLVRHGLHFTGERVAKCWRTVDEIPTDPRNIEVRELSAVDRDQYIAVNLAAWGLPSFFGTWFGVTMGHDGFRHYGIFGGDLLTSSVAMHVSEDIAWTGFGATRPEYQGRGYQTARIVRLLQDAAAMGCRIVHNEASVGTPESPAVSLHNLVKLGFNRIYDKEIFTPNG